MIKRFSLAAVSAALLGALVLASGATAQAPTCPPGTSQSGDYCVNSAGRVLPTVVFKVRPGRDKKAPFVFTTTGTVKYPKSVANADGCKGVVNIFMKAKKNTISLRRIAVHLKKGKCTFSSKVRLGHPKRFLKQKYLTVHVRFAGNKALLGRSAKTHKAFVK